MNLTEWTAANVTMKAERISARPDDDRGDWLPGTFHFLVTLSRSDGRRYVATYSMGPGHGIERAGGAYIEPPKPEAADVLSCLLRDASAADEHADALDYAAEYGFDIGDPKQRASARLTWRALQDMAPRFRAWLGDEYEAVRELEDDR